MELTLNTQDTLLLDSAQQYLGKYMDAKHFREIRDDGDHYPKRYSPEHLAEIAKLGWIGIDIDEEYGGTGPYFKGLCLLAQQMGRYLSPTVLLSSGLLGVSAINILGTQRQKRTMLPRIAQGQLKVAFAIEESERHLKSDITTRLCRTNNSYRLQGKKTFVIDAIGADIVFVVCRDDNKNLFIVIINSTQDGVSITPLSMIDNRNYGNLSVDATISKENLLGEGIVLQKALEQILDRARIAIASEMLGAAQHLLETTLSYLKLRKQFGVNIGSFQALQHRCARMYSSLEMSQAALLAAIDTIEKRKSSSDIATLASLVKTKANDTLELISNEAIQMHGGIGMTDELDLGFYLKRAKMQVALFGDSIFHRIRYGKITLGD
ncbi:acyl-CoA dehydrogenase family protein [Candidatus Uabimicrobium sp. HlEnr_7]|uniref:acyl-CoA dehydrogenase family protein n=1 Tax=Candidatus Uabimicrobium helgolandensis TaxID=3095367 RepID=UPI0035567983